jgi:predicted PurR-regulated permease PerM
MNIDYITKVVKFDQNINLQLNDFMLTQFKKGLWPMSIRIVVILIVIYTLWIFNSAFITPLLLGLIIATLTFPIYNFISSRITNIKYISKLSSTLGGILTILLISIILLAGVDFLGNRVAQEAPNFVSGIANFARNIPKNEQLIINLESVGISRENIKLGSDKINEQINKYVVPNGTKQKLNIELQPADFTRIFNFSGGLFKVVFDYLVYFVIFLLAWFNSLTSGKRWIDTVFKILPFSDEEQKSICKDLKSGVSNVVYANILGGLIHATICFVIMLIFGVPNIFILTILVFLIGVLPLSPSELAYALPLLLILPNNPVAVIIIAPIAELIILFMNYVLMPKIINSGQEGNPLLIITSILSGITIFGLMGFIIGPMIMILVQTLYGILISRSEDGK